MKEFSIIINYARGVYMHFFWFSWKIINDGKKNNYEKLYDALKSINTKENDMQKYSICSFFTPSSFDFSFFPLAIIVIQIGIEEN